MITCDDDFCVDDADGVCDHCAVALCSDHGGGDGNECPQCGREMTGT